MKQLPFFFALLLLSQSGRAQEKKPGGSFFHLSAGLNNHSYTRDYTGWFFRAGMEKQVSGGLFLGITFTHTSFTNFPRQFHVYSLQPETEKALLERWKGISMEDWVRARKGFYKLINGDLLSLQVSYRFRLGKRACLVPKLGMGYISSSLHTTGVFDAQFVNGRLSTGRIGYDFRHTGLAGWNFGLSFGYRLGKRLVIQLTGEDNRDINGELFNYYESKLLGAGLQYRLSRE